MMKEIERKFLVTDDSYRTLAYDKSDIIQGYISSGNGRTVRVRTRGDKGYLTIKGPSIDGISRFEWEKEITLDDARELFTLCSERIEKTRYLVHNGPHTVEVDEFHGENEGLVFAEIELSDVDEPYTLPPYLGREVTGDHHYYNAYICRHPYHTWEDEVE
ncbi:MAG: CYTH domain-containing protein [Bacteroidaceae bacterium]|nr:CYTH domain-containing protein [Bacteroidaceae bacterium]